MTWTCSFLCTLCSFLTCVSFCDASPVLATCPSNKCHATSNPLQVDLPLGSVIGTNTAYSAQRFTLPYALPPTGEGRFASPQSLTPSVLQSGTDGVPYDATHMPKACVQQPDARYGIEEDGVSEDCLYLNIYRASPAGHSGAGTQPVLVWVHGGSFVSGSSTAPGLDGSFLAAQNNVLVVTIQYRLGMFGFFSPSQFIDESASPAQTDKLNGNQGIRDAILALQFIRDNIAYFGGDPNSITLAGQSSGAHLIRALLDSDSAVSLFHRAVLHSDPANIGTQTLATSELVSQYALSQTNCTDLACLRAMSAQDVLEASTQTAQAGQSIDGAVSAAEVWRPFIGTLTGPPFEVNPSGALGGKPIIFTNVENEGGSAVGDLLMPTAPGATTAELRAYPVSLTREQLLEQMFNDNRASVLSSAQQYGMNSSSTSSYPSPDQAQPFSIAEDGLRQNLERILTQGMFTCATWDNAQRYSSTAEVYVGLFEKGIQYASNQGNDYCSVGGRVCHEDDIELVFTDSDKVETATARVVKEVQARWVAFMRTGSPNSPTYNGWSSVGASKQAAKVLRLGVYVDESSSRGESLLDTISLQAGQYSGCGQVWASEVQFDWQLYG